MTGVPTARGGAVPGSTDLRRLVVPVYAPAALAMASLGIVTPILALLAIERGAAPGDAALVVAMLSVGGFVGALPSALVIARLGDRWALTGALVLETAAILALCVVRSVPAMLVAGFAMGLAGVVLAVARQSYLATAVDVRLRGRAMSVLGGVFRAGSLVGALIASLLLALGPMEWALLTAAGLSACAAVATYAFTAPADPGPAADGRAPAMWRPGFGRLFGTLGVGGALVMLVRASRDALLPLWGHDLGLAESTVTLLFAVSSAVDLSLFYVAGTVMDRYGRRAAVVPAMVVMGGALLCLPLGDAVLWAFVIGVALGLGNGLSSGAVMTMGADAAPEDARASFLAGWRLVTGVGQSSGPVLVAAVVGVSTVGVAAVVVGALGLVGAGWLRWWLPAGPPGGEGRDCEGGPRVGPRDDAEPAGS